MAGLAKTGSHGSKARARQGAAEAAATGPGPGGPGWPDRSSVTQERLVRPDVLGLSTPITRIDAAVGGPGCPPAEWVVVPRLLVPGTDLERH